MSPLSATVRLRSRCEIIETPARGRVKGLVAGMSFPPADCYVDVVWVDLDPKTNTADPLSGNQGAPGTEKTVEDNIAPGRAIQNGIGHERDGFDGGMQGEQVTLVTLLGQSAHTGIFPDVGSIASEPPQHHVVAMWTFAVLEDED
jgi:hypothetical protein